MVLQVQDLSISFGGHTVLNKVSIEVADGKTTALIGPNGAGKTTLFNAICGHVNAEGGDVCLGGRSILGKPAHEISRLGVVRTFQTPREFSELSVVENLLVSAQRQIGESPWNVWLRAGRVQEQERILLQKAWGIISFLGLDEVANDVSSALSGGQKKLLELGRALMTDPQIILLDEPVAGVNPTLSVQIANKLSELVDQGMTLLVIEHNMEFVMQNSEIVYVLAYGQVVTSGSPSEVRRDPRVLEAYLGSGV